MLCLLASSPPAGPVPAHLLHRLCHRLGVVPPLQQEEQAPAAQMPRQLAQPAGQAVVGAGPAGGWLAVRMWLREECSVRGA